MILMTLQLVVTQTCCEAKLSPYSLHWNRYTFGLCCCGLFSYTIITTFFHWGFFGASCIFIELNFVTWNMLMFERHFRKTRAKRRDATSTVTKSNMVWKVDNAGCWGILDHLDKTRNIRIRHPKIVEVAVSGIALNIEKIRIRFWANLHATRFSWTYETGIGSIEGNEETEEVADLADWYHSHNLVEQLSIAHRHNQLEELIETEHLGANRVSIPYNLDS